MYWSKESCKPEEVFDGQICNGLDDLKPGKPCLSQPQGWATIFVRGPHCAFLGAFWARLQSKKVNKKLKIWSSRAGCGPRAVCYPLLFYNHKKVMYGVMGSQVVYINILRICKKDVRILRVC